jgi:superfamily I DNA and/or RNA helicase
LKPFPNSPAAWVDVRERSARWKGGTSWFNDGEAKKVAAVLEDLLSSDESGGGESLHNFGIITFYAGQRDAIREALRKRGLVDFGEDGRLTLARHRNSIQRTGKTLPRFALGTVDEFQGREYDVVILSTVRGSPEALDDDPDEGIDQLVKAVNADPAVKLVSIPRKFLPHKGMWSDQIRDFEEVSAARWLEIMARRWYGHLMLPNRLCVAMSRQQRQLIIVGNRHDLAGPRAQTLGGVKRFQHLGVFGAFYELCNGKEATRDIAKLA